MSGKSTIEWTDSTWNPVTGCTEVGAGCDNCYAKTIAERFRGQPSFPNGFDVTLRPHVLQEPLKWKAPRKIFVNSMSDLFHKDIPDSYIDQVFEVIEKATHHTYQILTKRSSRMRDYVNARYQDRLRRPTHIWFGVSIEEASKLSRMEHLKATLGVWRFISFEPLLAPIGKIDLNGIDWIIVGGESGANAREMKPEWVRELRDLALTSQMHDTAFFFKQWGGFRPKSNGRLLDGVEWSEFPNATMPSRLEHFGRKS